MIYSVAELTLYSQKHEIVVLINKCWFGLVCNSRITFTTKLGFRLHAPKFYSLSTYSTGTNSDKPSNSSAKETNDDFNENAIAGPSKKSVVRRSHHTLSRQMVSRMNKSRYCRFFSFIFNLYTVRFAIPHWIIKSYGLGKIKYSTPGTWELSGL